MKKLSVAIITLNEEKNIKRCLESLKDIADEIVIVDSLSTDRTKEISQAFDCRFIENRFPGHIEQKNLAIESCSNEHILALDADEALDDQLRQEILKIKENWSADAYEFNRRTRYVDQWVDHGNWYPDRKIRLFKKSLGKWGGVNPHDIIKMHEGASVTSLKGNLLHYSYVSVADHIRQTNRFTTIAAKALFKDGKRSSFSKKYLRPVFGFFKDYIIKRGFLGGRYGLIIATINAFYVFLKYTKIQELELGKNID